MFESSRSWDALNKSLKDLPILVQAFEDRARIESTTSFMLNNMSNKIKWISSREVKVLSMEADGFGDGPIDCEAFPSGKISIDSNIYKLLIKRTRSQCFNEDDIEDYGGLIPVLQDYLLKMKEHKIAEEDAYRWSKLANYGIDFGHITEGKTYQPDDLDSSKEALRDISADIRAIRNADKRRKWRNQDLVVAMSSELKESVIDGAFFGKSVTLNANGQVLNEVNGLNGVQIMSVDEIDFWTRFHFEHGYDGNFGFKPFKHATNDDLSAKKINWIIFAKKAPIALMKKEYNQVLDVAINPGDGIIVKSKFRHDLLVTESNVHSIRVNYQKDVHPES